MVSPLFLWLKNRNLFMNVHVKLLLYSLFILTLSACGGGGGGSEPPTYPEPPADTTPPVITLVGAWVLF